MDYFSKRYHPPGTPPGTLTQPTAEELAALKITLVDYTDTSYEELEIEHPTKCRPYLERDTITWIHIQGKANPELLQHFGELYNLHLLAMEDVLNSGQRPKVDQYDEQLFIVMSLPVIYNKHCVIEQVSLFCGGNFLISFHDSESDPFTSIRTRLRNHAGRLRSRKVDYLLYSLMDLIIDTGFPLLETLGERIEVLEDELLDRPTKATLNEIHHLKRELLLLRRNLWPQREVVNMLIRDDWPLITSETKLYFRDCYDHTIQIMDLLESYREMSAGMLDVYLSSVSNHLNQIMRVLTIIATLFLPLTFVAGVYGMNFSINSESPWAMPELKWYYGYPLFWLLMIGIAVGMFVYFKRKGWL
jgi:magnesium transporter